MAMEIGMDVVLDPLISDKFNIVRRVETVGSTGRSTTTNTTTNNICGVIDMYSDRELIREQFPEMQYATNVISVICKKKLQTAVTGYQPDNVIWRGDTYVVQKCSPYPQFGSGFYQAVCSSIDLTDASP